ncbi:unnamed protein product [Prorocentrum cordatum]|uniref:Uncharacterized protein n=1 Tax=Prorocentrum cordatum TaxID=2364126 RepID=A0ABN9QWS1_9DINO|nr:unnamed protein product [Polarella glacialis]
MAAECGCAPLLELARSRLQGRRAAGAERGQDHQDPKTTPTVADEEVNALAIDRSDEQAAGQEAAETRERLEAEGDRAELESFKEQLHELVGRLREAESAGDGLRQQLAEERLQSERHRQDTMELRVKAEVLQEQLECSTVEVSKLAKLQREQAGLVLEIRRLKSLADEREVVCQAQALELERRALAAAMAVQGPLSDEACSTPGVQDDGVDMAERSDEEREEGTASELSPEGARSPSSGQWEEALALAEARAAEFEEGWRQAEARAAEFEEGWRQAEARAAEFEEGWRQAEARAAELEEGCRQAEARAAALEEGAEELESKLERARDQAASAGGARLEALLQRAARAEGRADALAQKVKELCTAEGGHRLPRVPEESPVTTGSSGTSGASEQEAGAGLVQWDRAPHKRLEKRLSHGELRAVRQRLAAAEARAAAAEAREMAARSDLAAAQEAAEGDRRALRCELEEVRAQQRQCAEDKEKDPADKERGDLLRHQLAQTQELVQTWRKLGEQAMRAETSPEPGRVSPPVWRHAAPAGAPEAALGARGVSPSASQRAFLQASPHQAAREPRASGTLSALLSTPSVVRVTTLRHCTPPRGTVAGGSTR